MAEFCSRCEPEYFDLDLAGMAYELENEYVDRFICEGCGCRGIYKDDKGLLYLVFKKSGEVKLEPVKFQEL